MRIAFLLSSALLMVGLVACSSLPSAPAQPARYDFGVTPEVVAAAGSQRAAAFPVLALADIQARTQNENSTSVLYRLGYADGQALHSYAHARWSQPPALLVQQRLREILGQSRAVLSAEGGNQPPLVQGKLVPVLQLSLEEFVHHFADAKNSTALVRVRATLVQPQRGGDVLLGQQVFAVREPAAAPNAAAGTRALAQAIDKVGGQMQQWLQQLPPPDRSVR